MERTEEEEESKKLQYTKINTKIEKIKETVILRCITCHSKAVCCIGNVGFCYACRSEWEF